MIMILEDDEKREKKIKINRFHRRKKIVLNPNQASRARRSS